MKNKKQIIRIPIDVSKANIQNKLIKKVLELMDLVAYIELKTLNNEMIEITDSYLVHENPEWQVIPKQFKIRDNKKNS